ncbi:MAG: DUF6430 domain-containing protein [Gemmatimonadetes bacterium]|nr:DUF6430 domain-containing protein [Gemmatimonadota bacterium]
MNFIKSCGNKIHILIVSFRHFSLLAFIVSLLESLGVLWLIIESSSFFSTSFENNVKPYWWLFLLGGGVLGLYRALPKPTVSSSIRGTDSSIELRITDMFRVPAAFVIPCNRTFDTSLEDGIISPKSTQGQFTKLFFSDSRNELDRQICMSVDNTKGTTLNSNNKSYGKQIEFPVGTVAAVSSSGQIAYLVAIGSLNKYKRVSASTQDILDALPATWEFIRTRGELGPLCCPILGSGFSRVAATREELIREIIKSFVSACRAGRFCEKLTIAIAPSDFKSGSVNLETLRRFLEHECLYPASLSSGSASVPTGTPA